MVRGMPPKILIVTPRIKSERDMSNESMPRVNERDIDNFSHRLKTFCESLLLNMKISNSDSDILALFITSLMECFYVIFK